MVTTIIPTSRNINPKNENSKKLNFSAPKSRATEFTIRLVEVPINVQLPPKIPAKEMGRSNFDCGTLNRLANSEIILMKTITTAVVFIKAEIPPVINIKTGNKRKSGST